MYDDSDSGDSDPLNDSDDADDDDGDAADAAEQAAEKAAGSDYDSDKDPAWRPSSHKSPKRPKVSHVTSTRTSHSLVTLLVPCHVNCIEL